MEQFLLNLTFGISEIPRNKKQIFEELKSLNAIEVKQKSFKLKQEFTIGYIDVVESKNQKIYFLKPLKPSNRDYKILNRIHLCNKDLVIAKVKPQRNKDKRPKATLIKILKREVSALEKNPQFENISQHQIVTEKMKKLKLQIQSLKEQLETNQNEKQQCLDALTKITELEMLLDNTTDEYQAAQIENEIQTLNKTLQLKKLSRYDYKITQLLTQIESLEAEIKNLNQKKEILEDMISSNLPTKQTLEELQTLISEMEEALSQIENLKDCIFDKPMLEERLSEIRQENERLEQENKTILERGEINTEDKDKQKEDYKEYKHYAELFEAAVQLEEYFKSKNSTIPPKSAFEISRMAQKEIESKLDELSKKSSVRYFINLNTLSDNQEEEQLILARLKEIEKTSEEIEKLNQTYREKYSNASFEETKQLYQKLKSEIETQEKIRKISEIRTELKNIQDTLSYNLKVLTILKKKYRALNDTDYQRLTSLLFY